MLTTYSASWADFPGLTETVALGEPANLEVVLSGTADASSGHLMFLRALVDGQVALGGVAGVGEPGVELLLAELGRVNLPHRFLDHEVLRADLPGRRAVEVVRDPGRVEPEQERAVHHGRRRPQGNRHYGCHASGDGLGLFC